MKNVIWAGARTGVMIAALVALSGCNLFGRGDGKPKTPTVGQRVAILTAETGVEVDPAIADVQVVLPPATANDAWSQPGGNAAKAMEHLALGTALGKAWTADIKGTNKFWRLAAAPVVAKGRIFVIDVFARVHAFDANSGASLWSAQVGDKDDVKGGISLWSGEMTGNKGVLFGGGVSVDGDTIYATSGLGDVEAMNAADGKRIWKQRPGGPLRGAPAIGLGNIYVMSQDNQLFALKQADGSLEWTESGASELAGVFGVAAPAVAQGTIVAGFSSGELTAYRYENGRVLWGDALSRTSISTSVSALADIDASPVIDRGRVFAVGKGGRMVSLELVTGQRLWEINVAGISTPWIAGEWLFVITDDARLLCIARATGKVRWVSQLQRYRKEKKKTGPVTWTGPVLAGDRLIVANSEGELVNVSPADGSMQSTVEDGKGFYLPPIVANNTLYTLDNAGRLTAWR
jgi:outer membrane protein assembly factor BamB